MTLLMGRRPTERPLDGRRDADGPRGGPGAASRRRPRQPVRRPCKGGVNVAFAQDPSGAFRGSRSTRRSSGLSTAGAETVSPDMAGTVIMRMGRVRQPGAR